ncbi:MAG: hypothetical protein EXR86_05420 [Gammaproteobacteria bacterium]|nr:hypothetical protein [Gammaproteobacteria bacterium]
MTTDIHLDALLDHAAQHSPYYREQPWAERVRQGLRVTLEDIPLTPKHRVVGNGTLFFSETVPSSEGRVFDKFTSGSTGEPLHVRKTERHFLINAVENRRLELGWEMERCHRTVKAKLTNVEVKVIDGQAHWTIYSLESADVLDLLRKTSADRLAGFPSMALGVLQTSTNLPFLKLVATVGEVVPAELTQLVSEIPRCRLRDLYGSVETGVIAIQCPRCSGYHLADQHLVLEFLDEHGAPASPGQQARVVVTPLFNFAMPLIRYELGDLVIHEDGAACVAAKVIRRITGREKDLFVLPARSKVTPMLPADAMLALKIKQFKLVQISLTEVELRYIPEHPDFVMSAPTAQQLIDTYLSPRLRALPIAVTELPRSVNGKYRMHENQIRDIAT